MGRLEKGMVIISVILVIILSGALGLFLWNESKQPLTMETEAQLGEKEEALGEQLGEKEEALGEQLGEKKEALGEQLGEKEEASKGEGAWKDKKDSTEDDAQDDAQDDGNLKDDQDTKEPLESNDTENGKMGEPVLIFAGDVMPGNMVRNNYMSFGLDGILTKELQEELQQADASIINQEFPFSNRGTPAQEKEYTFRIHPSFVSILTELGVDAVSLANNHALDYGKEALTDTFETLEEAGIPYAGAGETRDRAAQPVYLECQGKTVGLLAASRVIPEISWNVENQQPGMLCTYDSAALTEAIKQARPNCDFLAVYVHWGVEKQEHPEEYQRGLAQAYIDAGADLVVGSHPHVPQGIEYYQGKPIVYSLGNFIFNPQMEGTYVLKVFLQEEGGCQLKLIPVAASDALTRQLTGQEGTEVLNYIEQISYGVSVGADGIVSEGGGQ